MRRPEQHTADWDDRFRRDDVPWEDESVAPAVVDLFRAFASPPATVLEIGCGLGTMAVWLAREGYDVAACDVSPEAVARASARAQRENLSIRFYVADVLAERRQLPSPDVIFARDVLHTFKDEKGRAAFAKAVAGMLAPGGLWLDVSGSADTPGDPADAAEHGWPRLRLPRSLRR